MQRQAFWTVSNFNITPVTLFQNCNILHSSRRPTHSSLKLKSPRITVPSAPALPPDTKPVFLQFHKLHTSQFFRSAFSFAAINPLHCPINSLPSGTTMIHTHRCRNLISSTVWAVPSPTSLSSRPCRGHFIIGSQYYSIYLFRFCFFRLLLTLLLPYLALHVSPCTHP